MLAIVIGTNYWLSKQTKHISTIAYKTNSCSHKWKLTLTPQNYLTNKKTDACICSLWLNMGSWIWRSMRWNTGIITIVTITFKKRFTLHWADLTGLYFFTERRNCKEIACHGQTWTVATRRRQGSSACSRWNIISGCIIIPSSKSFCWFTAGQDASNLADKSAKTEWS